MAAEMSGSCGGRDEEGDASQDKGTKKRQKMSKVWEHFKLDTGGNTVTCIHCKTALAFHNSTSSMLQHLQRRHPVYSESGGPSPETSAEMAAQQDTGKAEDALFLADMLLAQVKANEPKIPPSTHKKPRSAKGKFHVRWTERDAEGRPLIKRSRSGETQRCASATDCEMQKLQDILTTADVHIVVLTPICSPR